MKSILFLLEKFPGQGGVQVVTATLANYLAQDPDYQIRLLALDGDSIQSSVSLQPEVSCTYLNANILTDSARLTTELKHICNDYATTTVVVQYNFSARLNPIIQALATIQTRCIVVVHNDPRFPMADKEGEFRLRRPTSIQVVLRKLLYPAIWFRSWLITRHIMTQVWTQCDQLVALAPCYAATLRRLMPHRASGKPAVSAIFNPITIEAPTVDVDTLLQGKRQEMVCAIRLIEPKGARLLLDIWARFAPTHPDWTLRIVGDGPERGAMMRRVEQEGLTGVQFEGYRSDMHTFYTRARFVVLASWIEGSPLILTEGMAYGCIPCSFDAYDAAHDLIDDGVNGLLVRLGDTRTYARRLGEVADDVARMDAMSRAALAAAQRFEVEQIGKEWKKLL